MKPMAQGLSLMWRFLGRGKSRPASILFAVTWGTFSMMMLLAFGEGLRAQMNSGRLGLGEDPVILWAGTTTKPWEGLKPGRRVIFREEDVQAIKRAVPEIDEIAGEHSAWAVDMRQGTKSVSGHLTGVMPCFETIRSHHAAAGGRFFNDRDIEEGRRVIFLGPNLKDKLFGTDEAVGKTVFVRGVPFTVCGIMVNKVQNSSYGNPDVESASVPLPAFEGVFGKRPYDNLVYHVRKPYRPIEVEPKMREAIARRQHFDPEDKSAIHVWDTAKNHEEGDRIMRGIQIFLGMVGGMTLMVAGIGLANMLFVTVQRRTREIGLMMAIGARRQAVTAQVVGEALLLAGIGGYIGIAISWLVTEGAQRLPGTGIVQYLGRPTLSIPLAIVTVVVLVAIGVLSGFLPARRAAGLKPVEALRHD